MTRIVAKALLRDKDNRLLFLYRGDTHPNFPEHLDLPGGEIDEHEDIETGIIREVMEETGLDISQEEMTEVFNIVYPHVRHVLFIVEVDSNNADINLGWEHKSYKWFTAEEVIALGLDDTMDPYYKDVFNYLSKNRQ